MTTANKRYSYSRVATIQVLVSEDRLARPSPWVTSFLLSHNSLGVGERCFGQMVTHIYHLNELISPACDRYIQYFLAEANPSALNRHRRGYNLEGVGFPHTTSRPSQQTIPPFHLRAPPGLQFIQNLSTKSEFEF
jgi:hypothetical protein